MIQAPALPASVVQAKLSKVVSSLDPIKMALALYYQEKSSFPTTQNAWSTLGFARIPSKPAEISSLSVNANTGAIVVILVNINANVDGSMIIATPTVSSAMMTWSYTCTTTDTVTKKFFNC